MDVWTWLALLVLLLLTAYFTTVADSTYIVERPYHTFTVLLASVGLAFIVFAWLAKSLSQVRVVRSKDDMPLTLSGIQSIHHHDGRLSARVLIGALIARSAATSFLLKHRACTGPSLALLSPLLVMILQPFWRRVGIKTSKGTLDKDTSKQPQARSLPLPFAAAVTLLASAVAIHAYRPPLSTYICATTAPFTWQAPLVQVLSLFLDAIIMIAANELLDVPVVPLFKSGLVLSDTRPLGRALFFTASTICALGLTKSLLFSRSLSSLTRVEGIYLISLLKVTPLVTLYAILAVLILRRFSSSFVTSSVVFTIAAVSTIAAVDTHPTRTGLYMQQWQGLFLSIAMSLSLVVYLRLECSSDLMLRPQSRRTTSKGFLLMQICAMTVLLFRAYNWQESSLIPLFGRYDQLILSQEDQQSRFDESAITSRNVTDAASIYYDRHGKWPPPGFDKWYMYATERKSTIIDTFDNIYLDVLPFYALKPAELRERTHGLIVNPDNDVVGILIRDGRANSGPHVNTNNRAMVDGLIKMINKFAQHLPDMDIAFNTKESGSGRVVVPWEKIRSMRDDMWRTHTGNDFTNGYQPGRSTHWPRMSNQAQRNAIMTELHPDYENVFRYSTVWCPPQSRARTGHYWDFKHSCMDCNLQDFGYAPLYSWRQMHDVCSQPDLQYLHGMYSAPASFKATHEVYPVFSHSRANGFMDILYPSVWDWLERTAYAPDAKQKDVAWRDKKDTLFWRGTTTEGVSYQDKKWQGMLRQRFVHFINNIRNSSPPVMLLVHAETGDDTPDEKYVQVPAQTIAQSVATDVQFSPDIVNCREEDCHVQRWEFAPTPNVTGFQEHWQYKYLLDLDGASSSASFLPFLRSRSLPLKAGLMQEWWRDRVRPWVHFVPLDVRGLDLWSTVTWFRGLEAKLAGQPLRVKSHEDVAERIATAGKQLAETALRKEDMEIYFFRLLLEWARVTDDWRDHIGYTGFN